MAEFDSLSFALLIPFAICFALIFIVCCFADEIKDICRMPSPLPSSYLAPEHVHPNRRNNRRPLRQNRLENEEVRNLILSEEGRSRNVSESSGDYTSATNVLANSVSNFNFSSTTGASLNQTVMLLPQTIVPNVGQRSGMPNTSCIVLQPVVHTIPTQSSASISRMQPLSQLAAHSSQSSANISRMRPLSQLAAHSSNRKVNRNFSRNLTIHASESSKDLHSGLKPKQVQNDLQTYTASKGPSLNRNESAPHLLNSYLSKGSLNANSRPLSQTAEKQEKETNQSNQR